MGEALDKTRGQIEAIFTRKGGRQRFERLWGLIQDPPDVTGEALDALLKQIMPPAGSGRAPIRGPDLIPFFERACLELQNNLTYIESLAASRAHPPFPFVTWLWRVGEALHRVESEGWLAARPRREKSDPKPLTGGPSTNLPVPIPTEPLRIPLPLGERLGGLAVQPLIDLAQRETFSLRRRRRLLEAARRVLLETSAAVDLPKNAVESRFVAIANHIRELNLWQSQGVDPEVDLTHQLQTAVQERRSESVKVLLGVFERLATSSPDVVRLQGRLALIQSLGGGRWKPQRHAAALQDLSSRVFGSTAAQAVARGYLKRAERGVPGNTTAEVGLIKAGACVDGSFELGRSVAPVRVREEQRRMAEVEFPTATLVLRPAQSVNDLPRSVIHDPRLVLYDFASQSLLARRYLTQTTRSRKSAQRFSEARYYLLDGSASMAGRRGQMRDAVMISELAALIRHLECGVAAARPVVYHRYFSAIAEPLTKASTIEEAQSAIEAVINRTSDGETDIEGALIQSFQEIKKERESDHTLRRAHIVLITDGIADMDLGRVWAARAALGAMPVGVSVLALGSENEVLRRLAAHQRARREPVFYHFFSQDALHALVREVQVKEERPTLGELFAQRAAPTVVSAPKAASAARPPEAPKVSATIPPGVRPSSGEADPEDALYRELDHLVAELAVSREPRVTEEVANFEFLTVAYQEIGLPLASSQLEAARAHEEARRREVWALEGRFNRWFPEPKNLPHPDGPLPPKDLMETLEILLLTVTELVEYLDGEPLERRVDAIEIFEGLLVEAGVPPWAYFRALPHAAPASREALVKMRTLVGQRDRAKLSDRQYGRLIPQTQS